MDPNETLRQIRAHIKAMNEADEKEDAAAYAFAAMQLAESVEAMDEWLSKGGFLPEEWELVPEVFPWEFYR